MKAFQAKFQIGKQGITEGVLESLNNSVRTHRQVRVSILKSFCRDREKLKEIVNQLQEKIKPKCAFKVIGYTIVIIRLK